MVILSIYLQGDLYFFMKKNPVRDKIECLHKEATAVFNQTGVLEAGPYNHLSDSIKIFNATILLGKEVGTHLTKKNQDILNTYILILNNNSDLEPKAILEKSIQVIEFMIYMSQFTF